MKKYMFQYCQKLIVISADKQSVLLAKRIGENDYDGVFSFIGGKLQTTDKSIIAGMKREKDEEIGANVKIKILPNESLNVLFVKKDGNSMILPHIAGIFVSGDVVLSNEYSEYQWVLLKYLANFEPKIENITELTNWALTKLSVANDADFTII